MLTGVIIVIAIAAVLGVGLFIISITLAIKKRDPIWLLLLVGVIGWIILAIILSSRKSSGGSRR